ncbi:LysR family transcriptional regulator [Enterobacterales bacterium BD_CKDN230030183-1A_HGKHYDSX7]
MEKLAVGCDLAELRRADLNKLVVFVAVYRERSASHAAVQLGVKQPAISNTLAELRRFFDDELFVRRGRQLQATSRAEAIFKALEPALELLSELTMPYMKDTRKCSL